MSDVYMSLKFSTDLKIRNPSSTRPWQYVLDCLSSYYCLAKNLNKIKTGDAINFGPNGSNAFSVLDLVKEIKRYAPNLNYSVNTETEAFPETNFLGLTNSLSKKTLGAQNKFDFAETIRVTVNWYLELLKGKEMRVISEKLIDDFLDLSGDV